MALDVISMDPNLLDDFATKYLPEFLMSPTFKTMHNDLRYVDRYATNESDDLNILFYFQRNFYNYDRLQ